MENSHKSLAEAMDDLAIIEKSGGGLSPGEAR